MSKALTLQGSPQSNGIYQGKYQGQNFYEYKQSQGRLSQTKLIRVLSESDRRDTTWQVCTKVQTSEIDNLCRCGSLAIFLIETTAKSSCKDQNTAKTSIYGS